MRHFKYSLIVICLLLLCKQSIAGKKVHVLFIGNSYTYVNNMPQIVADIATSTGDTLVWDMEAPGGFTLGAHFVNNPPTIAKIQQGNWDYVVLQEQSQTPALPDAQVNTGMFPYARKLDSLINLYNGCSETIFYMTWGRKNGDAGSCSYYTTNFNWPYFCTYTSMDSMIRVRYRMMADSNQAIVSPAGAVWRYVRNNYPGIELYDADESHPSAAGSYAAACAFYTTIFRKDPAQVSYNYTLSSTDAANIRTATGKIVYDSMAYWHIGQYKVSADFTYTATGAATFSFTNHSANNNISTWYFGDGKSSNVHNPTHAYAAAGTYTVMLVAHNIASSCDDTTYDKVTVFPTGIQGQTGDNGISISPNPANDVLQIHTAQFLTQPASVTIINTMGQVLYKKDVQDTETLTIDISTLPHDVYTIYIDFHGSSYRRQFVKL